MIRKLSLRGYCLLACLLGLALPLEARVRQDDSAQRGEDTLVLKDGRLFDGVSLRPEADQLTISFPHGEVSIDRSEVLEYVLANGEEVQPANDEERELVAAGKVRYKGKWMSPGARAKKLKRDLAEQRKKIDERKLRRKWVNRAQVKTKNFNFESTTPDHVLEYYMELCEGYFQAFAKTWKIKRGKVGKLNLKFYVDQENYMQVTGMSRYVLGFFRFIEPYELNIFYDRLDPRFTEEVLFHELGHYLQKLIDIDFSYPHWPGESLSEYYGASTWNPEDGEVSVGQILPARVQEVLYDIASGTWVSIEELLSGAPERTYHDYTWGWTLVHFLMTDKRHAKNFNKFYVALAKAKDIERTTRNVGKTVLKGITGESMTKAFRKYMKVKSDEDLADMQHDWYLHIEENLKITTTRGLENAAFKNMARGRPLRAQRMLEEAIEQGSENPRTFLQYGELLESQGKLSQAQENYRLAIEHDGLVPEFYITLGESLFRMASKESFDEGARLLNLALDIEPDNFYLERNMQRLMRQAKRKL